MAGPDRLDCGVCPWWAGDLTAVSDVSLFFSPCTLSRLSLDKLLSRGCGAPGLIFRFPRRPPSFTHEIVSLGVTYTPGLAVVEVAPVVPRPAPVYSAVVLHLPSLLGRRHATLPAPVLYADLEPWSAVLFVADLLLVVVPSSVVATGPEPAVLAKLTLTSLATVLVSLFCTRSE